MRYITIDKKNGLFRFKEPGSPEQTCQTIKVVVLDHGPNQSLVRCGPEWCILNGISLPAGPVPVTLSLTRDDQYTLEVA